MNDNKAKPKLRVKNIVANMKYPGFSARVTGKVNICGVISTAALFMSWSRNPALSNVSHPVVNRAIPRIRKIVELKAINPKMFFACPHIQKNMAKNSATNIWVSSNFLSPHFFWVIFYFPHNTMWEEIVCFTQKVFTV